MNAILARYYSKANAYSHARKVLFFTTMHQTTREAV